PRKVRSRAGRRPAACCRFRRPKGLGRKAGSSRARRLAPWPVSLGGLPHRGNLRGRRLGRALEVLAFLAGRRDRDPDAHDDGPAPRHDSPKGRSEEHTSELQSHLNLVCRLLLEKKKTVTRLAAHVSLCFFSGTLISV